MAIDLKQIKNRLNKLQSTNKRAAEQWKPTPGKQQVRIVPYKYEKDNPFIELYFHYNVNGKTYLSPQSFGRPDPIVEFSDKLKRMGTKDDWKAAKRMEPKLRTYVPVLVRGEEEQGVRFWGFGKTVYQDILGYIADPDYGDITDPRTGRDITVEYTSAEDGGTQYPTTTIRVKPNETPLTEDKDKFDEYLEDQVEISELYSELTYDELKEVLAGWLNPDKAPDTNSVTNETLSKNKSEKSNNDSDSDSKSNGGMNWDDDGTDRLDEAVENKKKADSQKKQPTETKVDNVSAAFDDLFND